ncbi:MAG: preprotein translocase subunit SecY [Proteobacteria bacterium]|nr:preprotein translocase subunit SecY [Pseudomonadota bacterium]
MASSQAQGPSNPFGVFAKATELKKRILFVLVALIVYRLGTHIPLPGIDAVALGKNLAQLQHSSQGLSGAFNMFNMFSGGAFKRMTIFALNIMPYITASIIIQLLSSMYPSLQEMKKEGEMGRRKMNQYTRYLTVALAMFQGMGLAIGLESMQVTADGIVYNVVADPGLIFRLQTAFTLTAGSVFVMWLGEQISQKGVGNGASLIIFSGIVAELPRALVNTFDMAKVGTMSEYFLLGLVLFIVAVMGFVVFMENAQRRILIQYPKRQVGLKMTGGESNHMPLKLNMAGVIPAIFASSILLFPMSIASFAPESELAQMIGAHLAPGRPTYEMLFVAAVMFFCFFYTAVVFNPEETADNIKKSGGFIPGIRPGKATAEYFDYILTRLTVLGSVYIAAVCVLPQILLTQYSVPFYFGGTSLLIVVSVTLDTVTQIQSHLIAHRYEGLLKKTKFRNRAKA